MAVVRITQTVKWNIDNEIKQQFNNRRQPLFDEGKALLDGKDDQFREAVAGAIRDKHGVTEQQLLAVDPFVNEQGQLYVRSLNGVSVPHHSVPLRFAKPVPVPFGVTGFDDLTSPRLAPWATKLADINKRRDELDREEAAFRAQVMKLIQGCTTYKQALDIWPQLVSVTPREILDRHHRQVVRQKVDIVAPQLDVEQLNLSAVKNTLAAAKGGTP